MSRRLLCLSILAVVAAGASGGCNTDAIVRDGLSANDPGRADARPGPPPVAIESLAIAPTGLSATATPKVRPDPVLPKMDNDFRARSFPPDAGPTLPPATRAADLDDIPYSKPAFGGNNERGRP